MPSFRQRSRRSCSGTGTCDAQHDAGTGVGGEVRGDARSASRKGPGGSRVREDGAELLKLQGEETPPNSQGSRKSFYHPVPDKAFEDLVSALASDELLDVSAFGMEIHVDDNALNEESSSLMTGNRFKKIKA